MKSAMHNCMNAGIRLVI